MTKQILLIDDDELTHTIVKGIVINDFEFQGCFNLAQAQEALASDRRPSLVIIDRLLPDGDGLAICSQMRSDERLRDIPIIFLSSKNTETDKVGGLFAGADDYICKPVSPLELKARIQARLRTTEKKLFVANLIIDISAQRVYSENKKEKTLIEFDLTRIEFKLLQILARSPERVFTREQLLIETWGQNTNLSDRVVDTHICHLRKKIVSAGVAIQALRNEGYKLSLLENKITQAA